MRERETEGGRKVESVLWEGRHVTHTECACQAAFDLTLVSFVVTV